MDLETRYSHLGALILALVTTSTILRHYFEMHQIILRTNYSIKNVMRKLEMLVRMAKSFVKLRTYDIKYAPGSAIKSPTLVDFVVDFSDDLRAEVDIEAKNF